MAKDKNRKQNWELFPWLQPKRAILVQDIISAPTPLRNKSEFTFGYRYLQSGTTSGEAKVDQCETPIEPTNIPALGFMVTGWAGGVCRPHSCANIPPEACKVVEIVDEFLATSSVPPYDTKSHKGCWRTMTIRSSHRTNECMIVVMLTPAAGGEGDKDEGPSFSPEEYEAEKARLVSILKNAELPIPDSNPSSMKVTSFFFQEFSGLSHPPAEHPVQHVFGKQFLVEKLGNCSFQISPGAFFQVNTDGAELLYQIAVDKVREVSTKPEETLLFDVCCGTGTIGLTCLKEGAVGKVVGVDISQPAIADAVLNAKLNGYEDGPEGEFKTRFIASRAESVLHKEIGKLKGSNMSFVAVVDPARDGLHPDVVKTLRSNERISRIVYVSCNPTATLVRDAVLLCQPSSKKYSGRSFRVSSAQPVDMFPLTDHCEMVMTFDRLSAEEQLPNKE